MHTDLHPLNVPACTLLTIGRLVRAEGDVLEPLDGDPKYELRDLRLEKDRQGKAVLRFDYDRIGDNEGYITAIITGKSKAGALPVSATIPVGSESGTITLSAIGGVEQAILLRQSSGSATLKTEAGREVTLPIARLSQEDQKYLRQDATSPVSPFE